MRSNRTRPVALRKPEPPARESWYRIENRADETPSIFLYDEVGLFGVSAAEFVKDLRNIKADSIDLRVSSPGGDVFDGMAIHSALKNHPARINVHIDGVAASAASFIAQAGDTISIARNAQMMVHEGHAVCAGDSRDMRKCADLLDKVSDNIADVYSQRSGHTVDHWRAVMREETWYTADEAVKAGLADKVSGATKPENTWDLSVFLHAGRDKAPDPFQVWTDVTNHVVADLDPETRVEIATTPIVDLTGEPDPPPEPEPTNPPVEAGFYMPEIRAALASFAPPDVPVDSSDFRTAVDAAVTDVPAPDPRKPPEPEPAPYTPPPRVEAFVVPDIRLVLNPDIECDLATFRAAIELGVNDVPLPDPRPTPEQPAPDEPVFVINLPDVRRALKGALL